MANQTPAGRGPYTEYEWAVLTAMGARTIDFEATGPQTERSGVHNPDTDDLVTVELTREEAEMILQWFESAQCFVGEYGPMPDEDIAFAAKFRASLERTSK